MEKIAKIVRKFNKFLVTTHATPDGDGLGSQMALHFFLKKVGKKSFVINSDTTPAKFQLVDPHREIQVFSSRVGLPSVDAVFVTDTNDWKMLGPLQEPLRKLNVPVVFFDHHVPELEDIENHVIDEQYCSTGELIYSFLRHLKGDIDAEIAMAIYVAIVTDTNSFRFKRTSARSHLIASELLQKGILPEQVYQHIYARDSFAKIRLFGHVLENIKTSDDERIAWLIITKEMRQYYKATIEDTEAFVNQLTLIEGVDIGILFREDDDSRIKVSLRGNGEIPVFGIAKKFGGGGHRHAAGMKVARSLEEVIRSVLQEAKATLQDQPLRSMRVGG